MIWIKLLFVAWMICFTRSFNLADWLKNVKDTSFVCKKYNPKTSTGNDELLPIVSCEKENARWNYKYKNLNSSSKLKDPWTGQVSLTFSSDDNSCTTDGLKSKKCFDLQKYPNIAEIKGNFVNDKLEGPVRISFHDETILYGYANENRFQGVLRNFDKNGNLNNVTNADNGFLVWRQDNPDVLFIESSINKDQMFIMKSNGEIFNCKSASRLLAYFCRDVQSGSLQLLHVEGCAIFFDPEPQPLTNEWQKLDKNLERKLPASYEVPCKNKDEWNKEDIREHISSWIEDITKEDFFPWFYESSPDPLDPMNPRLELTIPNLKGRENFQGKTGLVRIESLDRELFVAKMVDGKINEEIPDSIANLEEWHFPVFFYFTHQTFDMTTLGMKNKKHFFVGRLRFGRLHGLAVRLGAFTNDPKGYCSGNIFDGIGYIGRYNNGVPEGNAWKGLLGGAWIYGKIDKDGYFNGNDVAYIYPDLKIGLKGYFKNDIMVRGQAIFVIGEKCDQYGIKELLFTEPSGPSFHYKPPTNHTFGDNHLLVDPLEDYYTELRPNSTIPGAGEALYARVDIPKDTTFAIYSGLVYNNVQFQIIQQQHNQLITNGFKYDDPPILSTWQNRLAFSECDINFDLPSGYEKTNKYSATLGHKINHSFMPNSKFTKVDSPRLGATVAVKAMKDIKAGEELFVEYGYSFDSGPGWYKELVLTHLRDDPNFFKMNSRITNERTLDELEKVYEKYKSRNKFNTPDANLS